jgi:molybdopterin-containing oxidoreductase family membrane subunit
MTATVSEKRGNDVPLAVWIVLAVLGLGGLGLAWGMQLARGMEITGLGQRVVWGLYIAGFFTAMGAGSALVTMAAMSEFSILIPLKYRRSALLMALVGFAIGGVLIAMDVGNPINLWRILTAGRFTSMMTWDFWALILTGLLTLVYLAVSWKKTTSTTLTKFLGVVALISAVMLVVVEGWMLASLVSRPLWSGGFTVVNFIVLAFVAGLGIGMLAWQEEAAKIGRWLLVGLSVTLALTVIEVLTSVIEARIRPFTEISLSLFGSLGPMFWVYVIIGLILPLAILAWRKEPSWLRTAAILAIVGVIAEKLWLLAAGQAVPWLDVPVGFYTPTWIEWVGVIGAVALAIFLYLVLTRLIKVQEA